MRTFIRSMCLFLVVSLSATATPTEFLTMGAPKAPPAPTVQTPAPDLTASGYILMDYNSGQIVAQKNIDKKLAPASLTKMMTLYIVSSALKSGQISLDTRVPISEKAWRTGGSRMFVKVGTQVPAGELIKGIIVASGNDACVAMAEFLAGSEEAFATIMNQTAASLGMKNSHFVDSTGMPNKNHYSTARDLAILGRALIRDFPEYYHWYKQKWFTYNDIKQPNRNRLLWRDESVDGLKTGHTDDAGYCLVASAKRNDTRLVAVILGTPNDNARANDAQSLINYGFRFFETHKLFSANTPLSEPRVWLAKNKTVALGVDDDFFITIPAGQYKDLKATVIIDNDLQAPIVKGQQYGSIKVTLKGREITTKPLIALIENPKGGLWTRFCDRISIFVSHWIG